MLVIKSDFFWLDFVPLFIFSLIFMLLRWEERQRESVVPTTNVVCKMEAQLEYVHVAYTYLHVWKPICMLSRCLLDKVFCIGAQSEVY